MNEWILPNPIDLTQCFFLCLILLVWPTWVMQNRSSFIITNSKDRSCFFYRSRISFIFIRWFMWSISLGLDFWYGVTEELLLFIIKALINVGLKYVCVCTHTRTHTLGSSESTENVKYTLCAHTHTHTRTSNWIFTASWVSSEQNTLIYLKWLRRLVLISLVRIQKRDTVGIKEPK